VNPSRSLFSAIIVVVVLALFTAGPALGKDVLLLWNQNPESDLSGYRVHYRTTPGAYTTTIDVGKVTSYLVTGLQEATYYFAVTAYDTSGRESTFSNEVFAGPITMVYPRLAAGVTARPALEFIGIALANLDDAAAVLRLTALDKSGSQPGGTGINNPVVVNLDSGRQIPFINFQLFGDGLAAGSPIGWVRIDSTVADVSGFFLMFDGDLSLLDGGIADAHAKAAVVLTEVDAEGYTKICIVNPHAEAVTATITLVNEIGTPKATIQRGIPGQGSLVEDLAGGLFTGMRPAASDYVRIIASRDIVASMIAGREGKYVKFLAGQDSTAGGTAVYSPQYAVRGIWRSTLSVINLDGAAGNVTLRFIGDDGIPIGSPQQVQIAGNGKIYINNQDFFQIPSGAALTQGYVEITSDGVRLTGNVVFGDAGLNDFSTALPLVSNLRNSLLFGHVASNDTWYTGLAVINPNDEAVEVTIEVFKDGGPPSEFSKTLNLPANTRISGLLTEYFEEMAAQDRTSGYIRVTTNGRPVAAFALFGTNSGSVLSAIPPQAAPAK